MCRRFHGAAFATYADVDATKFDWLKGKLLLKTYETAPGAHWTFCSVCGSSLGALNGEKLDSIALGTFDSDPGVRPAYHMFVGSKAVWYDIVDDLPQFQERPPEKSP
jgi:hypothetical protein